MSKSSKNKPLQDKVALVTGASRGIGIGKFICKNFELNAQEEELHSNYAKLGRRFT